ncbi:MAG: hypothetical protein QW275_00390, partial [Candidatus Anstonellaceae archaeon]
MAKKRLVLIAFLIAISGSLFSENNLCPLNPEPAYLDIILEPPSGPNSIVTTYVYNISKEDYVKNGISGALIIVVNQTDMANPNLCYGVTDSEGWANFTYNSDFDGCTNYWFIFCPQPDALSNLAARQTCLNGTGISQSLINAPLNRRCDKGSATPSAATRNYLPAHNQFYVCTQQQKTYAGLCWPLMLIFGLLLGANFLLGRNPFASFDFSAIRLSRGRQYTMRAQQRSLDFASLLMAAVSASETFTGGRGLQTLLKEATSSLGKEISGGKGEGENAAGNLGKEKNATETQTNQQPNNNVQGRGMVETAQGATGNLGQLSQNSNAQSQQSNSSGQPGSQDLITIHKMARTIGGAQSLNMPTTSVGAPSIIGGFALLLDKKTYEAIGNASSAPITSPGQIFDNILQKFKQRLLAVLNFGSKSEGSSGWRAAGERILSALMAIIALYSLMNELNQNIRGAKMFWKALGGKSKRNRDIKGIGFFENLQNAGILTMFGRRMNLGEVVQMITNPSSVYLLSFFAPLIDSARDKLALMMATQPDTISLKGKEVEHEEKKYTIVNASGELRIYDSEGNQVEATKADEILKAVGLVNGINSSTSEIENVAGRDKYIEVDKDNKAKEIGAFAYERNVAKQMEYNNLAKDLERTHYSMIYGSLSPHEKEMLAIYQRIKEAGGDVDTSIKSIANLLQILDGKKDKGELLGDSKQVDYVFNMLYSLAEDKNFQRFLGVDSKENAIAKLNGENKKELLEKLFNNGDAHAIITGALKECKEFQLMLGITWQTPDKDKLKPEDLKRLEETMNKKQKEIEDLIGNGKTRDLANNLLNAINDSELMKKNTVLSLIESKINTIEMMNFYLYLMLRGDNMQAQEAYIDIAQTYNTMNNIRYNVLCNMKGEILGIANMLYGKTKEEIKNEINNMQDPQQKEIAYLFLEQKTYISNEAFLHANGGVIGLMLSQHRYLTERINAVDNAYKYGVSVGNLIRTLDIHADANIKEAFKDGKATSVIEITQYFSENAKRLSDWNNFAMKFDLFSVQRAVAGDSKAQEGFNNYTQAVKNSLNMFLDVLHTEILSPPKEKGEQNIEVQKSTNKFDTFISHFETKFFEISMAARDVRGGFFEVAAPGQIAKEFREIKIDDLNCIKLDNIWEADRIKTTNLENAIEVKGEGSRHLNL